jgi:hypothetical protein
MDWQLPLVALIVAVALAYLARQTWRTWSGGKGGCGKTCACTGATAAPPGDADRVTLIPADRLTLRPRRPAP